MGNESYNVYARSPDSNLRVVAIEPGQFVRVDLTMQAKWKYNAQEDDRWYIYAKSGFGELQFTTINM